MVLQLKLSSEEKKKQTSSAKERFQVGVFLLATAGASAVFWLIGSWQDLSSRFKKKEVFSPSKVVFSSKLKTTTPSPKQPSAAELSLKVSQILSSQKGDWAIWVEGLDFSFSWSLNGEDSFPAASLMKLPLAVAVFKAVEEGELSWDQKITVTKSDLRGGAGSLQYQKLPLGLTLERLVFLLLNQSDNTAFATLVRILGEEKIKKTIRWLGMEKTSWEEFTTTAKDQALFFRKLYEGELFSPENTKRFFDALTDTAFESRIPKGVPEGVRVAHKVATEVGTVSDAGVVFVPHQPFILVILSRDVNSQEAEKVIVDLTDRIYWFLVSDQ